MAVKPPTLVDLAWDRDLRFKVSFGVPASPASAPDTSFVLDSAGRAGPSPVEALAASLGGCMAMDLVHILTRGRHMVRHMTAHLSAVRAEEDPRRLVRVQLHFIVGSSAADDVIERAIALSREKYCSVWQSLRQDIDLEVTFARD